MVIGRDYDCPYCERTINLKIDLKEYDGKVNQSVYCGVKDGGCGRLFIVNYCVDLKVISKKI